MPINGISVGKDITVTFNNNTGNIVTTRVKMFSTKQKTTARETVALDGVNRHLNIPMGWTGSIEAERTGPELETFIFNLEQIYAQGGAIPLITITETINEPDGSTTQWQYQGCVITMDSSGDWKGDDYITQKINFEAQAKIQQA